MNVLFWDFDGTLVRSNSLWSRCVLKALQEVAPSTTVTWKQIRPLMWGSYTWDTPLDDHHLLIGDAWWQSMLKHIYQVYLSCGVNVSIAETATASFRSVIKRRENYELYPDTVNVLSQAKSLGMKNVILSNNYPDLADVFPTLGLSEMLDGVIVSALEGYDKPRLELFSIAMSRFPGQAYMIGDNPYADIFGGNQAGMTTILVHHSPEPTADFCCSNLTEVLSVL